MLMKGFTVFLISLLIVMITVDMPNFFMLFSAVAQEDEKSGSTVPNEIQSGEKVFLNLGRLVQRT